MGKTMWILVRELFLLFVCCNRYVLLDIIYEDLQLYEGSRCKLKNGAGEGICVKAFACPARIQQIWEGDYSSQSANRCGFRNFTEIFCCAINQVSEKFKNRLRPAEAACLEYTKILTEVKGEGYSRPTVFNGVRAMLGEFPHMAAILGYSASEPEVPGGMKYICGGTLISKKHVLSAAHCVSNIQRFVPVEVLLGTTDIDVPDAETTQRVPISRIIKHPEHKPSPNYRDVAILELKNSIYFTADVYPTCLMTKPLTKENVNADSSFVVLGWGAEFLDGMTSTKLLKAEHLHVVDKNECFRSYINVRTQISDGIDDGKICVSNLDTLRRAEMCWVDSGGPLLISSKKVPPLLAGVTSFSQTCRGSTPGIYEPIYKYLNWIEDQVWPK